MPNIRSYKELRVYQAAMDAAMEIFELTKGFPPEEKFSLIDQMRRSSRSVCTNIGEAWRKRRYPAHFRQLEYIRPSAAPHRAVDHGAG